MRNVRRTVLLFSAAFLAASSSHLGADQAAANKKPPSPAASATQHTMVTPDQIKWGPAAPGLPPGGQMAVIDGDPGKAALFTARLKMPDGYKIPPHWHPTDEQVTVLSGTLKAGSGAKWDDASMHQLAAGSYANMRRKQNHYVMAQGDTVVQITAMGPFAITYVNAQDDPRRKSSN
jgi:quercetin dioxygenase-like cupin family protein